LLYACSNSTFFLEKDVLLGDPCHPGAKAIEVSRDVHKRYCHRDEPYVHNIEATLVYAIP
jgi:hypothetical protein